jgi:hypothetical protein
MLNVWKYGYLSEKSTFIGYLCEICSMWKYGYLSKNLTFIGYLSEICSICENMTIWVKIWISLVICVKYAKCAKIWSFDALCSITEAFCSVSDKPYTKSGNCSTSDDEKGRCMLTTHVSHLKQRGMHSKYTHLTSEVKGDVCMGTHLPFT